ncbi:MAG: preprotein translocase subunit SecG [Prevotella sp.]|nr:preprotein translocase subunit SecG [Prevotella sp.]
MYTLFVILIVAVAFLMMLIVLIQESKGGGLSSNFSAANQLAGVRKTTDFVEKMTWGLAVALVVLSIACSYVAPTASQDQSVLERPAAEQSTSNPNNLPGFGAAQQDAKAKENAPATAKPAETEKPAAEKAN